MKPTLCACLTALLLMVMWCSDHRYYVQYAPHADAIGHSSHGWIFDHWTGKIVKEW